MKKHVNLFLAVFLGLSAFVACDKFDPITDVEFADNDVKKACIKAFDTNGDKQISYDEAAAVIDFNSFKMPLTATSFDELQYFLSISYIPDSLFAGCTQLRSVKFPKDLTGIGDSTFVNCKALNNVNFPSKLETIGAYAFANSGLEGSETQIGNEVVKVLTIPASLKSIGYNAFANCVKLYAVQFLSTEPCEEDKSFRDLTTIYVPVESYNTYKNKWSSNSYKWADTVYNPDDHYDLLKKHVDYLEGMYSGYVYDRLYLLMTETRGDNTTLSGRTSDPLYNDVTYTDQSNTLDLRYFWYVSYKIIYNCNYYIEAIQEGQSRDNDHILGENYFLRAMCHLNLCNLFATPYSRGKDMPGVVIRTSPDCSITKRATVGEVYSQIISDLENAMRLMKNGQRRGNAGYVSYDSARGLLTRVYLYMGEWEKCIALAEEMLGGNPSENLDDITNYFPNTLTSKETLWCIEKSNSGPDYSPKSQLASMYYSNDAIGGTGWCEMYWSDPLLELIFRHPEDKRLTYFGQLDTTDDGTMMVHWPIIDESNNFRSNANVGKVKLGTDPENLATLAFDGKNYTLKSKVVNGYTQYYITGMYTDAQDNDGFEGGTRVYVRPNVGVAKGIRQTYPAYTMSKFSWQDGDPMLSSPALIRWAEVILNLAEAYAHIGNESNALKYVNVIRTRAGIPTWSGKSAYKAEGYDNILDVVLDERRLELCFEGHRAIDLYRNGKSIDRRYAGVHDWEILEPSKLDVIFPYCIPSEEIVSSGISGNGKN